MKSLALFLALTLCVISSAAWSETRDLELSAFDKIDLGGSLEIRIKQGPKQSVRIIAAPKVFKNFTFQVERKTLTMKKTGWFSVCVGPCGIEFEITVPEIRKLELSGSVDLVGKEIDADELKIDVSGSAEIELSGKARKLNIEASGSIEIDAFDLKADIVVSDISGSSTLKVHAVEVLDVEISGSGEVFYSGHPEKIKMDVSGSVTVEPRDEGGAGRQPAHVECRCPKIAIWGWIVRLRAGIFSKVQA
jgi:hypothetical protein